MTLTFFIGDEVKVIFERDSRGCVYSLERGEILRPSEDNLMRKHSSSLFPLIKDESWGIKDD